MSYTADWARYFLLTLVVELAVAVPLLGKGERLARRGAAVAFAQLVSHPAVWFVVPGLGLERTPFLLAAETWAIVSELCLYRLVFPRLSWSRVLAVSALSNGASVLVGTFVR
jgi:hypothetical protein